MTDYKLTTLCYLTKGDKVLFMVKGATSKNISNMNAGKYLGVGGHMEQDESSYECVIREIYEETGISEDQIDGLSLKGVATFINDSCDNEVMYIYKGEYTGSSDPCPGNCDEGVLCWVPLTGIWDIPVWEGDKEIFKLLFGPEYKAAFEIKLNYSGDDLISVSVHV